MVSELLDSSLVKKVREQVKTKGYAATDGNFLSNAHYRDPYFDFRHLFMVKHKQHPIESKAISILSVYMHFADISIGISGVHEAYAHVYHLV